MNKRKRTFESRENDRLQKMIQEANDNYRALQIESKNKDNIIAEQGKEIARLHQQVETMRETYDKNVELAKKARASCDEARKRYLALTQEYEKEMGAWMKAVRSTAV